jgi:hypothetical protein
LAGARRIERRIESHDLIAQIKKVGAGFLAVVTLSHVPLKQVSAIRG